MTQNLITVTYIVMILGLCLKVILLKYSDAAAEKIFSTVSSQFNFKPTYLEIYDQSTRNSCNRLIVLRPYEWGFWAINGHCYVLNTLRDFECPSGTYPTMIIDAITSKISDPNIVCFPVDYSVVKSEYSANGPPIINQFNMEDIWSNERFTIYDALNYLFKYYVEINLDIRTVHPANRIMIEVMNRKRYNFTPDDLKKVKQTAEETKENYKRK